MAMSTPTTIRILRSSHVIVDEEVGDKTGAPLVTLSQWDTCPEVESPAECDDMVVLTRDDALALAQWILERFSI